MSVLEAEYTQRLDAAGEFTVRLALTDPRAATAQVGRIWEHFREGQGFVFAGLIERVDDSPDGVREISGLTLLGELQYRNTLLNRQYAAQTINVVVDGLLPSPWTRLGSLTDTITARYDGESILGALRTAVLQQGKHFRESVTYVADALVRKVEIGAFGTASGVVISNGHADDLVLTDKYLAAVTDIKIQNTSDEIWNWIIPLGAGEGTAQLTLKHSTRTTPYTIQTVAGPDGRTIYFLSDAASITSYGTRERPFVAKDVAPLSNTKAALQAAANALYDLAVAQLTWWKDSETAYVLGDVLGLTPAVKPGDTIRLRYRGAVERWDGLHVYLNIDSALYVLERTSSWGEDGVQRDRLVVSNLDRALQTPNEVIIGKLDDTARSFRTHVQTGISIYTVGPGMEEVSAALPYVFNAFIPDNVAQLLRLRLRLRPRAIRSPVNVTVSGGSQAPTSSSGGGQTPTSAGGSSHSHNVTGQTAESSVAHSHTMFLIGPRTPWVDPPEQMSARARKNDDVALADIIVGVDPAAQPPTGLTLRTYAAGGAHTHTVTTATSAAEASHNHTVTIAAHNHTVTIAAHTHSLTFGIFEGGSASGLGIKIDGVDRTVALGGPWNAAVTIDITAYMLDADGVVVQGEHEIKITTAALGRVEVWQDWSVLAAAIPV